MFERVLHLGRFSIIAHGVDKVFLHTMTRYIKNDKRLLASYRVCLYLEIQVFEELIEVVVTQVVRICDVFIADSDL